MAAKRGLFVAPFDELVDPNRLAHLAVQAEERGWNGFFVWDHIRYSAPTRAVADPWVSLAAVAYATERLTIGPLVTPLARRRVQKLAKETVTLDHLSRGRLVLGVGLGSDNHGELGPFGEVDDPKERARLLDDGLERLTTLWGGELEPPPIQEPRIPIWVAGRWPSRRPLKRAARWDGYFPIDLPGPEALKKLKEELDQMRGPGSPYELVVEIPPGTSTEPWEDAGATWCLTSFGQTPTEAEVRQQIDEGPR